VCYVCCITSIAIVSHRAVCWQTLVARAAAQQRSRIPALCFSSPVSALQKHGDPDRMLPYESIAQTHLFTGTQNGRMRRCTGSFSLSGVFLRCSQRRCRTGTRLSCLLAGTHQGACWPRQVCIGALPASPSGESPGGWRLARPPSIGSSSSEP